MRNKGRLRRATSIFNSLGCLTAHRPGLMLFFFKKKTRKKNIKCSWKYSIRFCKISNPVFYVVSAIAQRFCKGTLETKARSVSNFLTYFVVLSVDLQRDSPRQNLMFYLG